MVEICILAKMQMSPWRCISAALFHQEIKCVCSQKKADNSNNKKWSNRRLFHSMAMFIYVWNIDIDQLTMNLNIACSKIPIFCFKKEEQIHTASHRTSSSAAQYSLSQLVDANEKNYQSSVKISICIGFDRSEWFVENKYIQTQMMRCAEQKWWKPYTKQNKKNW